MPSDEGLRRLFGFSAGLLSQPAGKLTQTLAWATVRDAAAQVGYTGPLGDAIDMGRIISYANQVQRASAAIGAAAPETVLTGDMTVTPPTVAVTQRPEGTQTVWARGQVFVSTAEGVGERWVSLLDVDPTGLTVGQLRDAMADAAADATAEGGTLAGLGVTGLGAIQVFTG